VTGPVDDGRYEPLLHDWVEVRLAGDQGLDREHLKK